MRDIDINVMTVSRPENYLMHTLNSLNPDWDPNHIFHKANLVYGSPERSYLDRYEGTYEIIGFPQEEWDFIQDKDLRQRASWNYWRCLTQGIKHNNGVIVFEDDVKFAKGWRKRLEKTIDQIERLYAQDYVLSMYACYPFSGYRHGLLYENYSIPGFYGTQGMYFTEKTRLGYGEYIKQYGVDSYHTPYDLLLKEYLNKNHIKLFATTPSIVQHMGANTTGLGHFHQATYYLEELPEANE